MRTMLSADHDNVWIHVIGANLWRRPRDVMWRTAILRWQTGNI